MGREVGGRMKRAWENLMRFGAWLGGTFAFLLTGCALVFLLGILLMERASAGSVLQSVDRKSVV